MSTRNLTELGYSWYHGRALKSPTLYDKEETNR
jgi:hypothetical protein